MLLLVPSILTTFCNCQVLLNTGAKLTADKYGWTPLHAAAASVTPDGTVIRLLVEAVIRSGDISLLDAKTTDGQNTALHLAARNDKAPSQTRCRFNTSCINYRVRGFMCLSS